LATESDAARAGHGAMIARHFGADTAISIL
jgi:hypothetical protein